MTPTEYRAAIKALGLTQNAAGEFFGVNPVTARRWAKNGPPAPVAKFLRFMVRMRFTPEYVNLMIGD